MSRLHLQAERHFSHLFVPGKIHPSAEGKWQPLADVYETDKVILPARNRGDAEEIGEDLRQGLEFIFVETVDEVFRIALTDSAKPLL